MVPDAGRDVDVLIGVMQSVLGPQPLGPMLEPMHPVVKKISHSEPAEAESERFRDASTVRNRQCRDSTGGKLDEQKSYAEKCHFLDEQKGQSDDAVKYDAAASQPINWQEAFDDEDDYKRPKYTLDIMGKNIGDVTEQHFVAL